MPYSNSSTYVAATGLLLWMIWKLVSYVGIHPSSAEAALYNIPGPPPDSYLFGNLKRFFSHNGADFNTHVATGYGTIVRLSGFFCRPVLYVADPKALYTMLIKEEHIFTEAEDFVMCNKILFGDDALACTSGSHHARQRKLLNPVFSVNHMRDLLPLFYDVTRKLCTAIASRVGEHPQEIDLLHWIGRAAVELIGQGGLGYSLDPLDEDSTDEYQLALKALSPALTSLRTYVPVLPITERLGTKWFWRAIVKMFHPGSRVDNLRKILDTLDRRSKEIYYAKRRAFEQGDVQASGKDIFSVLMRANLVASASERLSEDEVIAQISLFIFAAMDTTSSAVARVMHILAGHPDIQERLRRELFDARAAEGMPYENLNKLPLLDSICRETLRLHPPVTIIPRTTSEATVLPLSQPVHGLNGQKVSELAVPAGTQFLVGFKGCNVSKSIWGEDALEWKPERWLSPLPSTVTEAHIPGAYTHLMSFLGGKKGCIGFKYAEMEMKVVLAMLVSAFKFELSERPIQWNVAGVWYPTTGKEWTKPELPLKVSLYTHHH